MFLLTFSSCSKDEPVAINGNIYGKITDNVTNTVLSGVEVSVSGNEQSTITGQDGSYQYTDITAGSYIVSVSKSGYLSDSKSLTVTPDKTTVGDFSLQKDLPNLSSNTLAFDSETTNATITLANPRDGVMNFSAETSKPWLTTNPKSGVIQAFNSKIISISVDLSDLSYGNYQEFVIINVKEASVTIYIDINYLAPSFISIENLNSNQEYKMGNSMTMEWESNLTGNVKIDLLKEGSLIQIIKSSIENNKGGSYIWLIPALDPAAYQFKVSSIENPTISVVSIPFGLILGPTAPSVKTNNSIDITENSISILGEITNIGLEAEKVIQHGHVYSASNLNPSVSDQRTSLGESLITMSYQSELMGLEPSTTYYISAYASNSNGTAYGEVKTVTTLGGSVPTLTTTDVTQITNTAASSGGTITDIGGSNITESGLCWGLEESVSIESNIIINTETNLENFVSEITGLTAETKYYIKAYAKNAAGVGYGNLLEFTTTENTDEGNTDLATLLTKWVTSITQTSAKTGGNITNEGSSSITERGVVFSTSQSPTTSDSVVNSGDGIGDYDSDLLSLIPNTTYYLRAFAVNSSGTAYGNEISFVTLETDQTLIPCYSMDCESLDDITNEVYTISSSADDAWSIDEGYSGNGFFLSTGSYGGYIEFSLNIPSQSKVTFWTKSMNPGNYGQIPVFTVDSLVSTLKFIVGQNNPYGDWVQLETEDLDPGNHTIRIEFPQIQTSYSYWIDEIEFWCQ